MNSQTPIPYGDAKTNTIKQYLETKLTPSRYEHVLGVRDTAVELAKTHDADSYKVHLAALLHDCAKWMTTPQLYEAVANSGIELDDVEQINSSLLHAIIAVQFAVERFSVDDPDILGAIRRHTTGHGAMTLIDRILYVADFAEPNRSHKGRARVRNLADQDLVKAVFEVARYKIAHLLEKGVVIHPDTIAAYNSSLRELTENL